MSQATRLMIARRCIAWMHRCGRRGLRAGRIVYYGVPTGRQLMLQWLAQRAFRRVMRARLAKSLKIDLEDLAGDL